MRAASATDRAAADVRAILHQGGDPRMYRQGLADRNTVPVETIDALIATAGSPRIVDAETVAQERLAEDRRLSRVYRREYLSSQHEEC